MPKFSGTFNIFPLELFIVINLHKIRGIQNCVNYVNAYYYKLINVYISIIVLSICMFVFK